MALAALYKQAAGRVFYLLLALYFAAAALFCIFYLVNDYGYLNNWYTGLNGCFYGHNVWSARFFTPDVKSAGNRYCLAALPATLVLTACCIRKLRRSAPPRYSLLSLRQNDLWPLLFLMAAGFLLVCRAAVHARPYMDEVFSAVHCAELHPFQTLSYYMVPNNHLLFNVVNSLLFRWHPDLLLTGRIISGAAFFVLLPLLYWWLRHMTDNRWVACCIAIALLVQYPVWGFSAQCRGYSLYLLAEWSAFIALWQFFRTGNRSWLPLYSLATVVGFATMPTFLYFGATLLCVALLFQVRNRQWAPHFLKYQLAAWVAVGLFYLPALSFSGLGAFIHGESLSTAYAGNDLLPWLLRQLAGAFRYCFAGNAVYRIDAYIFLPLVPLLWLLSKRKNDRELGWLLLFVWLPVLLISVPLRVFPFMRNLNGHFSITYALLLLLLYRICVLVGRRYRTRLAVRILFPAGLALIVAHFVRYGYNHLVLTMYQFDTNEYARLLNHNLDDLPPGAQIGFSDDSYYLLYIGREKGFQPVKCPSGTEPFYIKTVAEPLPHPTAGYYEYRWKRGDYRIYQLITNREGLKTGVEHQRIAVAADR